MISYREEAAQTEVGERQGKGKRGRTREETRERGAGSGHGGGAALYGQDSARKAGGESRDVIPQLYPAVTVGGKSWRGRKERQEDTGGGEGEKGHGRNKKKKEGTHLSRTPGATGLVLPVPGTRAGAEGSCGLGWQG